MDRSRSPGRYFLAPGIVLACMLLAWRPSAFALDPALDLSQYSHRAWKIRDGFPKGQIYSIAQTPDGYLWLGTEFGLLRFDGIRNVPWQPPAGQHLPSNVIYTLLAARDGALWIGTSKGLASWKDNNLRYYPELAGQYILALLEDREGMIWAGGAAVPTGRLCAIRNSTQQCFGIDGAFGRGLFSLYEDHKGNLWAGVTDGLWRWKPGPPKFFSLPGAPDGIQGQGEDDDGKLLIGWRGGIHRFVDGKTETFPLRNTVDQIRARMLLRDRDGGLWIGTVDRGLVREQTGRTDVFAKSDGLSGDIVFTMFEDREGNIWVATDGGLDCFRDFAVATFSVNQGLSNATIVSVLVARDGNVWLATRAGLNRWKNGQITVYRERSKHTMTGLGEIVGSGLPEKGVESLFQDNRGRIWVSTVRGLGYLENDRFISINGVPGGTTLSICEDAAGNLWIVNEGFGLFHLLREGEVQQISWARLGHKDHATALAADPLQGGIWLGFHLGGVANFTDGQIRASYSAADGLGEGRVNHLRLEDGTVWAATDGGLSRLKNGRVATLSSKNGLPCDTVHWAMEDDYKSFWLYTACGLVRIARSELDAWAAAVDQAKAAKWKILATVFDNSDGVRSLASGGHYSPQVAKSADGKLWFLPWDGVSVFDPQRLRINNLQPPVQIEQIIADGKTYDLTSAANWRLPLPPLSRDLEIEYTALSFAAPEKVRFRYKLEGYDNDWRDAGDRRKAFYTNLSPRNYRFRVTACNNSGVWNEAGAFLDFSIAPAYYQTAWFLALCVAAFLALLAALHQLRLRHAVSQFNLRIEERMSERMRLARDIHDTLLQTFQAVLLKFEAVKRMLPDRPDEARQNLESFIDQAQQAVIEGRDAVQGLRASTVVTNELAQAISVFGEELIADQIGSQPPAFHVIVEGASRDIVPLVRDEVYRIACEALHNAFRHSQAKLIEVEIQYGKRRLRICFRDDGIGIDPKVLSEGGRDGHFGLGGMYERAKIAGGKLEVFSRRDSGTEVELTIPSVLAYLKPSAVRRRLFSRKGK